MLIQFPIFQLGIHNSHFYKKEYIRWLEDHGCTAVMHGLVDVALPRLNYMQVSLDNIQMLLNPFFRYKTVHLFGLFFYGLMVSYQEMRVIIRHMEMKVFSF